MLSGIKKGKKKAKALTSNPKSPSDASLPSDALPKRSDNLSVADRLRQSLPSGKELPASLSTQSASVLDRLQERGRIESDVASRSSKDTASNVIVELPMGQALASKKEEDMTVQELVAQERQQRGKMSWDEQMTRNMTRLNKNRKRKLTTQEDSDEEVERMKQWLPGATNAKEGTAKAERSIEKTQQRDRHRLIHERIQEDKITNRCSWWLESSSFKKHRLLAIGDHISLIMAPPKSSLIEGNHFYLVPLKHTPSFVNAEADVWREVLKFQSSLSNMYARHGKSIILLETVLESSKGLWQTKMEAIPVPFTSLQDAPMYFSTSMREQTEDWGTHNKILQVSTQKPLTAVIPKGFPYFYVDWGKISTSPKATGMAQIIESGSFRHDFGLDTVAAMLDLEPMRFKSKASLGYEEERTHIQSFLQAWEKFDWTKELDVRQS